MAFPPRFQAPQRIQTAGPSPPGRVSPGVGTSLKRPEVVALSAAHTFPRSTPAVAADRSAAARLGISVMAPPEARHLSLPRSRLCCRDSPCRGVLRRLAGIIPRGRDPTIPTNGNISNSFGLVGEQSNAYRILLRYDRKSRHRRIKKQRRYERLAATSQLSLW